jgi:UDP-N-acetyl-D-mannosaminuronate dehydrogenase
MKGKAARLGLAGRAKPGPDAAEWLRLHCLRLIAVAAFASCASVHSARAETCFNACFKPKLVGTDIEDSRIRSIMRSCRDTCEEDAERRLSLSGRSEKLLNCLPEPISVEDFKRVRAASPSFVAFANTFTWDVHNVLTDRVIKRVEAITQNLELEDVVLGGGVTIAPGETETVFIPAFFDGYPQMRVSTRIKAIYACSLE